MAVSRAREWAGRLLRADRRRRRIRQEQARVAELWYVTGSKK